MKTYLVLFFIFSSVISKAQFVGQSFADPLSKETILANRIYGNSSYSIFPTDQRINFSYGFKLSKLKFGLTLHQHDQSGKTVRENKVLNGDQSFGPVNPYLKKINGDLYLISFQQGGEEDSLSIHVIAALVDTVKLDIGQSHELLSFKIKNFHTGDATDFEEKHRLLLRFSRDSSKMLVSWSSGMDNKLQVAVLDSHFNLLWQKEEELSYKKNISLQDACVDNAGNAYLSYELKISKDNSEGHVSIIRTNSAAVDKTIQLADGHPYQVFLQPGTDPAYIQIAGIYEKSSGWISGAFHASLNTSSLSVDHLKSSEISPETLELLKKDAWARTKGNDPGCAELTMSAYTSGKDEMDLIGEFREEESTSDMNPNISGTFILSGDVLWIHFNGDKMAYTRIPKLRVSAARITGDSYGVVAGNHRLYVLYNDKKENLEKGLDEKPIRSDKYNNDILVKASLRSDGTLQREMAADLTADHYLALTEELGLESPLSSVTVIFARIKGLGGVSGDRKWVNVALD